MEDELHTSPGLSLANTIVLVKVLQKSRTNRRCISSIMCESEIDVFICVCVNMIYYKELAHAIMEAENSQGL